MVDLKDVAVFEPLPDYLRTSLEAYQKSLGCEAAKSGAMRAILGRLLKRLEEETPSKGIVKGQKTRYLAHRSNLPGSDGWSQGRHRCRRTKTSGTSSAGSSQRQLPQDHWRQYEEPALWMAAQAGDTKICQQLLAARAEVTRGGRVDAIDGRRPSAGMGKWYRFC